jgi:streptogramin lyase
VSLLRIVAIALAVSALIASSAVAGQRATSNSSSGQGKNCGYTPVGVISDPGSSINSLAGPAADACSCPPGVQANKNYPYPCRYVVTDQPLFPGETLTDAAGTVTIKGTGKHVPSFNCRIQGGAQDVIYPATKSPNTVTLLRLKKGTTSCLVSQGRWQSQAKPNAVFMAGSTPITIKSQSGSTKKTTNQSGTSAEFTVGDAKFTVHGNPVFGMTTTTQGSKPGTLIQLTRGNLFVGSANGKGATKSLGQKQQVFVPAAPNAPARVRTFTQPAAVLKHALCALSPDLRETNKVTFAGADPKGRPLGLAADSAGNIWFTDGGINEIGEYNLATHRITYDTNGLNTGSSPQWIATGPNGTIWFTDVGTQPAIGKLNPGTRKITEFPLASGRKPWAIAYDPRYKNLWFTDQGKNDKAPAIGVIDPASGAVTSYTQGLDQDSHPEGIAVDTKGRLWFTDDNDGDPAIGMLDPAAKTPRIVEWPTGIPGSLPRGITAGENTDTHVYFADERTVLTSGHSKQGATGDGLIGVIDTTTVRPQITEYAIGANGGNSGSVPEGPATGTDGNVWFTDNGTTIKTIGMIDPITGAVTEASQSSTGMTADSAPVGILLISKGVAKGLWFADQLPSPRVGVITAKASC